jgi:hypothetical protein
VKRNILLSGLAALVLVVGLVVNGPAMSASTEVDLAEVSQSQPTKVYHEITQSTRDICTYIEALRFGLNPNGVVWTNCSEQHYWGEHQVAVRYWSTSTWDGYCVIYDRRGFDPNGWAIPAPCLTGVYGLTGG